MKEFYITDDGIRYHAKLDMPEGTYYLATPQCLFYKDGHYAAALRGGGGSKHTVVYDGKALAYSFNGYCTSVKLQ